MKKRKPLKLAKTTPRLSICMIVKNEEEMLPKCLESIREVADEIIIVDTGSTDNTVAIAESFGAKVYFHPWEKDFSKHRNQSLSYATGDWILQIDADETLEPESKNELKRLLRQAPKDVNGFFVQIHDYRSNGQKNVVFNFARLYRNGVGVHYEGIVHNQVIIPGKVLFCNVRLNHYGYDLEPEKMKWKYKRVLTLLKKQLKQDPKNSFTLYNLANTYSMSGKPEKAIFWGEKTLEVLRRQKRASLLYVGVYYPIITSYIHLKNYQKAREYCQEAIKIFPYYLDGYYQLTRVDFIEQKFTDVLRNAEKYHQVREYLLADLSRIEFLNLYTFSLDFRVNYWMGVGKLGLGAPAEADKFFQKAFDSPLFDKSLALEMIHNISIVERGEILYTWLQKVVDRFKNNQSFVFDLLHDLKLNHGAEVLRPFFERDKVKHQFQTTEFLHATWHYFHDELASAEKLFQAVPSDSPYFLDAQIKLVLIKRNLNQIPQAITICRKLLDSDMEKQTKVSINIELVKLLLDNQELEEASRQWQNVWRLNKKSREVLLFGIEIHWKTGQYELAVNFAAKLLEELGLPCPQQLDSLEEFADLLDRIGKRLLQYKEFDLAERAYQIATLVHPDHLPANLYLARANLKQKNYSQTLQHLQQVLMLEPANRDALNLLREINFSVGSPK